MRMSATFHDKKRMCGRAYEQSHLLWGPVGCSSVPGRSSLLHPCSDGNPPSWPCACPPAPTHKQTHISDQDTQLRKTIPEESEIAKNKHQTLEALDWLRRSFCSKIFEYFLRSFLIIWEVTGNIHMKERSPIMILFVHYRDDISLQVWNQELQGSSNTRRQKSCLVCHHGLHNHTHTQTILSNTWWNYRT